MRLLERHSRESGRDYALRTITDNIIHLELAPGSLISENELSAEMGLSRTPVREALIELAKVKIVEISPQRRSIVAPINYELVDESRFMRNLLECAVVELACEMATEEDLERLRENVRLQNFYLDNYYPDKLMELDNQFHQILFEIARKSQIYMLMRNIAIHFDRVRNMALSSVKNLLIVQDHENLILAIEKRDKVLAKATMEEHLNRYKIDAQAIREAYPQYFTEP